MTRKRLIWIGAVATLAVAATALSFALRGPFAYAHIATGYAAQQTCACMYVTRRSFENCMNDYPEDARSQIRVAPEGDRVRASAVGGLFKAEAIYEDGFGCRLTD